LEQQIKLEKQMYLDQFDTNLKNMKRLDYIYLKNDPDTILQNMLKYKNSNNYQEQKDARDYLLRVYPDANILTIGQKIPDDINTLPPLKRWEENKKTNQEERNRLYRQRKKEEKKNII
jgi:hypothetical protein